MAMTRTPVWVLGGVSGRYRPCRAELATVISLRLARTSASRRVGLFQVPIVASWSAKLGNDLAVRNRSRSTYYVSLSRSAIVVMVVFP